MKAVPYTGLPSIEGKSAIEAVQILAAHCQQVAEAMIVLNQEVEDLKSEVNQLKQSR